MEELNKYLLETLPNREDWMIDLEQYAEEHGVPIMEPVSMNFIEQLIKLKRPKRILEIGTAIGYSALRMQTAYSQTYVTTIERNEEMYSEAISNIKRMNKEDQINVLLGDAIEVIENLYDQDESYDFIFIDAAKGKYKEFFQLVQPLVNEETVIVCDNILFRGYVANRKQVESKRLKKLADKIDQFNRWLMEQSEYSSTIIPIGDGLTMSVKK